VSPAAIAAGVTTVLGFGVGAAVVRAGQRLPRRAEFDAAGPPSDLRELLVAVAEWGEKTVLRLQPRPLIAAGLAAGLGALVVGTAAPVVAVVVLVTAAGGLRRSVGRRVERSFVRGLVPALEGTVAALHAGQGLRDALVSGCTGAGGVIGLDGRALRRRMERGASLVEAMDWWARRRRDDDLTLVVAVVRLAHELGGPAVASLEAVAEVVRARRSLDDEVAAHAAQAIASAVMLAALPVVSLALVALSDPSVPGWLLGTPGGVACLVAGGLLEAGGVVWMVSVVRGVR